MLKVEKRNNKLVEFDATKIFIALEKAFKETGINYHPSILELLTIRITGDFADKVKDGVIKVEDIQDSVENVLMSAGYNKVAKAYIEYRNQHAKLREIKSTVLDYKRLVDNYLKVDDWRVKENSTVTYSIGGLILSNSGAITANYWLSEIYDKEIATAHRDADIHIHDLSMLSGYCAGWSLKQLIQEGLGGVTGKVTSKPASHLVTLCGQMVNFLGIMQNEWAGAQAFSSFDTYLAPFVKVDNLDYIQVKQCIQSFVFGINVPSRWGCVPLSTEILTEKGWRAYDEVHEGDLIYTWRDGKLELNPIRKVVVKPFKGKLHSYESRGYKQIVTPDHRMLVRKFNSDECEIMHSKDIFNDNACRPLPIAFSDSSITSSLSDELIKLAAIVYTDGAFDYRPDGTIKKITIYKSPNRFAGVGEIESLLNTLNIKYIRKESKGGFGSPIIQYRIYGQYARDIEELVGGKTQIASKFFTLNQRQADLFLRTWAAFDGNARRFALQYDNDDIRDALQHIAILAGHTSYVVNKRKTSYVKICTPRNVYIKKRREIDYDNFVWCPNVENGTAVFREDNKVFISGQCQAPFSNITLDWVVPNDLAELPAIVGGKEMNFCYKDCQKEMDMINKAFLETMIEGDANGRGFQYPIPTYSITKDFNWEETENNRLLFEMAAKYGTPYFSNYVNSDMEPSDIRSMCPVAGNTQILWYSDKKQRFFLSSIKDLHHNGTQNIQLISNGKLVPAKVNKFDIPADYEIELTNGVKIKTTANHLNKVLHKPYTETRDLTTEDYLPVSLTEFSMSDNLNYDIGKFIGAYLGDGNKDGECGVVYSLNPVNDRELIEWMNITAPKYFGKTFTELKTKNDTCVLVHIYSHILMGIIKEFVEGSDAYTKAISMKAISQSKDFRLGIIDGYIATDGTHSGTKTKDVICTASKTMVDSMYALCNSVGIPMEMRTRYTPEQKITFPSGEFNCQAEHYYMGLYRNIKRQSFGDKYKIEDGYMWFRIKSITKLCKGNGHNGGATTSSYCMEILSDDEPVFMLGNGVYTHNCRLRLDLRELRKKSGGFFGSGESTGSIGVVTINMPRIAYLAKDKEDFYNRLAKLMDISARSLHVKRVTITKFLNEGLYPYTKRYLGTFANHFSTIGLVGMNEACLNANWLREDLTAKEAQEFTKEVLNFMRNKLSDYQEQYGDLYNLEATPAESTSYRLAKHDKEKYPDIITANSEGVPYYTNSSHLPVGFTTDIFEALDIQDDLQTLYTSGTVFHAFLGEKLPDWKAAANLVRKIAYNYKLPYYTISPTYSVCKDHGYLMGEQSVCPICGNPTEVYSRITGYYRPVQNWNDGKKAEYANRVTYDIGNSTLKKKDSSVFENIKEGLHEAIEYEKNNSEGSANELLLFTTKTCPNCKMAKMFMEKSGLKYTLIDVEENMELVKQYNISKAPTLVDTSTGKMYTNAGQIKLFTTLPHFLPR